MACVLTPRPFSCNPTLIGSTERQSSKPTVWARPLRSSSLFRTAPVVVSLSLPGGYTRVPPPISKHSFSCYSLMALNLLALLPLLCHVVVNCAPELTAARLRLFFRSAFVRRSEALLSIELLMDFLVTFSPGTVRECRCEEAQWRGFIEGVWVYTGLTGHFDCPDKFEMLRWLLAAGTGTVFRPKHLWVFPVGFLRDNGCLIRQYCIFAQIYA